MTLLKKISDNNLNKIKKIKKILDNKKIIKLILLKILLKKLCHCHYQILTAIKFY